MRRWINPDWSFEQAIHRVKSAFPAYDMAILLHNEGNAGWKSPLIAGLGAHRWLRIHSVETYRYFMETMKSDQDYIFGHFGYNAKEFTEGIHCSFPEYDGFDTASFFIPEIVVIADEKGVRVGYLSDQLLAKFHARSEQPDNLFDTGSEVKFIQRTSRERYLESTSALLRHIHRGDIYEINYCIEFYSGNARIDPLAAYHRLSELTQAPFGGLYKNQEAWLLCGSPELYLRKTGRTVSSQPIKGTRKRGLTAEEDERLRNELRSDPKEQSENIMIVDLVRNDLSRFARKGSVRVPELFAITSHKTVHQMSSTVQCEVEETLSFLPMINASFPMGSMTGAPKISAMQLAEKSEDQSRGIYSGSIGYITPEKDFEFNVVIRSITWNAKTGYLSVKAGSAITANCSPEKEYEECLLKTEAMINALKRV